MAIGSLALNTTLTVPVRAKFAVPARDLIDSIQPDTDLACLKAGLAGQFQANRI